MASTGGFKVKLFDTRAKPEQLFKLLVTALQEEPDKAPGVNKYVHARTEHLTLVNLQNCARTEGETKHQVYSRCLLSLGFQPFDAAVERARETRVNNRIRRIVQTILADDEATKDLVLKIVQANVAQEMCDFRARLRKEMLTACANTRRDLLASLKEGLDKALKD